MGPMLRWFVFTIGMGLPYGFSVLLQTLRGVPPRAWQNSPELLFFSVMVCAVQLGEIFDTLAKRPPFGKRRRAVLGLAFGAFLISGVVSAGLYGVYIDQERNAPACHAATLTASPDPAITATCKEWLDFQTNLYRFSMRIALFTGCFGTVIEWLRTRRRI
jgi:hypothetical protein